MVKENLFGVRAMKTYRHRRGTKVRGQPVAPGCSTKVAEPWYSLNRRLDVPQSRSKLYRDDRDVLNLPGVETRTVHPIDLDTTENSPIPARKETLGIQST
jgi:hypothetical protein